MTGKYTNEPAHPEMTGAEIVLQALRDNGVEHIFGYPGAAVLPIYDEIFQQQDIRHILVRHEQGAGHAAEGYARSTGKTGVMLVTSGPGVTNTITSLQNAMIDSVPIVCLSGQVATTLIGSDAFQECDTLGITGPCTKHSWLVTDVSKLAETIHKAFRIAHSGRPGPVLVDMPKDILVQSTFYTGPSAIEKSSSGQQWEAFYRASPDTRTDEMADTIAALQYALDRLYELTRNHSPFVTTDLARHRLWSSQFDNAGQRTTSSGFGTIGYGLPAAIGMQIAHPESLVIDIADRSSVQATMKELSTAVQYKAPVKVFILNNESAEPLRQQRQTSHSYSKTLPDFVKMAEAFGAVGMRCDKVDELDSAIEEMIAVKGPVLFDCHIADCSPTKADNPI